MQSLFQVPTFALAYYGLRGEDAFAFADEDGDGYLSFSDWAHALQRVRAPSRQLLLSRGGSSMGSRSGSRIGRESTPLPKISSVAAMPMVPSWGGL